MSDIFDKLEEEIKNIDEIDAKIDNYESYPMLALRGISVFPKMLLNFDVERKFSIDAINEALSGKKQYIFMLAQKDMLKNTPTLKDLYKIGTVCVIKQVLKLPNNTLKVMVEGKYRARLEELTEIKGYYYTKVSKIPESATKITKKAIATNRICYDLYDEYRSLSGSEDNDNLMKILASDDSGYIADFIAQDMVLAPADKQSVLEELNPTKRIQLIIKLLKREIDILDIEHSIAEKTQAHLINIQKENILREQLKVIQSELGDGEDSLSDTAEYKKKINCLNAPATVKERLVKEVNKLAKQPFGSSESSVIKSYLDTCLELPWLNASKDSSDIKQVAKVLDDDHYGLKKVKERIIEHLSVKQLAQNNNGAILCLVGPPGVGKTSIAISIAKAMNRKLARVSLGGVHDEAEIRGHRKTYVGAMPGRIISALISCGTNNPLMLFDEIDKLGSDFRGDPASALLEALDSEQNSSFRDHFVELPVDLSNIFFITTANSTDTIPAPLLDRMEVIEITSYTDEEKLMIAKEHLVSKQRKKHGLNGRQLTFSDDGIRKIISLYTRESGVRQLERQISTVCRRTAKAIVDGSVKSVRFTDSNFTDYLGTIKYKPDDLQSSPEIGIVKGLAWTSVGGAMLEVEVNVLDGTGKLELTGNLGDIMKESAKIAVSYVRSIATDLNIDPDFYKTKDIHIHFPEGAVPKDGPSAGITMTIAIISALSGIPVRSDVAMTGEISLRGRVMAIGGLNEKSMAALRNGIKTVIIPYDNLTDLDEIDPNVKNALSYIPVKKVDDVLSSVLDVNLKKSKGNNSNIKIDSQILPTTHSDITGKQVNIIQ